jgi:hypothetical protein
MSDKLREKAKAYLADANPSYSKEVEKDMPEVTYWMADFAESLLPKWTYCEDALPETNGWYLISTFNGMVTHCEFSVRDGFYTYLKVIAWMPKPAPAEPKEAK